MQSLITREYALAQASLEHGVYFLELGANEKAAAYFKFAAQRLQGVADHLADSDEQELQTAQQEE